MECSLRLAGWYLLSAPVHVILNAIGYTGRLFTAHELALAPPVLVQCVIRMEKIRAPHRKHRCPWSDGMHNLTVKGYHTNTNRGP